MRVYTGYHLQEHTSELESFSLSLSKSSVRITLKGRSSVPEIGISSSINFRKLSSELKICKTVRTSLEQKLDDTLPDDATVPRI